MQLNALPPDIMRHIAQYLSFSKLVMLYGTLDRRLHRLLLVPGLYDSLYFNGLDKSYQGIGYSFLRHISRVRHLQITRLHPFDLLTFRPVHHLLEHLNSTSVCIRSDGYLAPKHLQAFPAMLVSLELHSCEGIHPAKFLGYLPHLEVLRIITPGMDSIYAWIDVPLIIPSSLRVLHLHDFKYCPAFLFAPEVHASNITDLSIESNFIILQNVIDRDIDLTAVLPHALEKLSWMSLLTLGHDYRLSNLPSSLTELIINDAALQKAEKDLYELVAPLPNLTLLDFHFKSIGLHPMQFRVQTLKLPRMLTNLKLLGPVHFPLSNEEIDQLPKSLTSLTVASFDLERLPYFRERFPVCLLSVCDSMPIEDLMQTLGSALIKDMTHLNPFVLCTLLDAYFANTQTNVHISSIDKHLGVWRSVNSLDFNWRQLYSFRSIDFHQFGISLLKSPAMTLPNLTELNIDVPERALLSMKLKDLPRKLVALDLHSTAADGNIDELPESLTRITSTTELDLTALLGELAPKALQYLDTPLWTLSACSILATPLNTMTRLCSRINRINDFEIVELLTKNVDLASRANMELFIVYTITGALTEDIDAPDVNWTLLVDSTASKLKDLLSAPFPGSDTPTGLGLMLTPSEEIQTLSIPPLARTVALNPRRGFGLAPLGRTPPPLGLEHKNFSSASHLVIPRDNPFFSAQSQLVKLELAGVFIAPSWWGQLPASLLHLHISSSSPLIGPLPTHLETLVHLCTTHLYSPLSLPLHYLPSTLVHFVSLPASFSDATLAASSFAEIHLPNLQTVRLGPTTPSIVHTLVKLLPMATMLRLEVEDARQVVVPNRIDALLGAPPDGFPLDFPNFKAVEEVDFSDVCQLPRLVPRSTQTLVPTEAADSAASVPSSSRPWDPKDYNRPVIPGNKRKFRVR